MNKYSYTLAIIGVILWVLSEFVNRSLAYVGFGCLILAFLFPMIVTKTTGKHYKGN
ncbi:MAG: hypothetical protein ACXQS3_00785 [Candidatus Methanofastidiosia archaeon]